MLSGGRERGTPSNNMCVAGLAVYCRTCVASSSSSSINNSTACDTCMHTHCHADAVLVQPQLNAAQACATGSTALGAGTAAPPPALHKQGVSVQGGIADAPCSWRQTDQQSPKFAVQGFSAPAAQASLDQRCRKFLARLADRQTVGQLQQHAAPGHALTSIEELSDTGSEASSIVNGHHSVKQLHSNSRRSDDFASAACEATATILDAAAAAEAAAASHASSLGTAQLVGADALAPGSNSSSSAGELAAAAAAAAEAAANDTAVFAEQQEQQQHCQLQQKGIKKLSQQHQLQEQQQQQQQAGVLQEQGQRHATVKPSNLLDAGSDLVFEAAAPHARQLPRFGFRPGYRPVGIHLPPASSGPEAQLVSSQAPIRSSSCMASEACAEGKAPGGSAARAGWHSTWLSDEQLQPLHQLAAEVRQQQPQPQKQQQDATTTQGSMGLAAAVAAPVVAALSTAAGSCGFRASDASISR